MHNLEQARRTRRDTGLRPTDAGMRGMLSGVHLIRRGRRVSAASTHTQPPVRCDCHTQREEEAHPGRDPQGNTTVNAELLVVVFIIVVFPIHSEVSSRKEEGEKLADVSSVHGGEREREIKATECLCEAKFITDFTVRSWKHSRKGETVSIWVRYAYAPSVFRSFRETSPPAAWLLSPLLPRSILIVTCSDHKNS